MRRRRTTLRGTASLILTAGAAIRIPDIGIEIPLAGLKVAALAGLPAPVLARAAELLAGYTPPAPSDPQA